MLFQIFRVMAGGRGDAFGMEGTADEGQREEEAVEESCGRCRRKGSDFEEV